MTDDIREMITDRLPTEADGDWRKLVWMQQTPFDNMTSPVYWAYVGFGVPWKHTSDWKAPTPRVLPGVAGQWISGKVKPLKEDAEYDNVQIRLSAGEIQYCSRLNVSSHQAWRPYVAKDRRPVVLAGIDQ